VGLAAFVQSAGAAMGAARDSFGTGGAVPPPASVGTPPGPAPASGQAAAAALADGNTIHGVVATLEGHDQAAAEQLIAAAAASNAGRDAIDAAITAALADIAALGESVDTPQGQADLVAAIKTHLQDAKTVVDTGSADASTRAAAAHTIAATYATPSAPMTSMPSAPTAPPTATPMSWGPAPTRADASPVYGPADPPLDAAAHLPAASVSDPPVSGDRASVARYIYRTARAHGYSPHDALAITAYADGESSFRPTVSPGAQYAAGSGGDAYANTVVGLFQEKPAFASDVGIDPALRYTVEGNTEAYLRQLAAHPGGDIFDRLLATSVGGPMYTGGRSKMQELMAATRQLIGEPT